MSTYQTKGDGIAIFRTKSEAGLLVVAKADGFRSGETEIDGRNATSTRLTLQPARRFLGRVIDSGGRPVASAKVVALVSEGARRSFYDTEDAAVTDAKGEFELRHIPIGTPVRFLTIPGSGLPSESQQITVSAVVAGGAPEIDLVAAAGSGASVRGIVRGADGRPVAFAQVHLSASEALANRLSTAAIQKLNLAGITEQLITTDQLGRFEAKGVPAGEVTIRARWPGFVSRPQRVSVSEGRGAEVSIVLSNAR